MGSEMCIRDRKYIDNFKNSSSESPLSILTKLGIYHHCRKGTLVCINKDNEFTKRSNDLDFFSFKQ